MPKLKEQRAPAQTTSQSLGSLIKSCRDIMRKDKGLNGDLDRLPMLTWIMFLKFLDDMERIRETESKLAGKRFIPTIEPPYRWRDWAENPAGITGDALIAFINQEEAVRSDGKKGPGLFSYLRSLRGANGGDRRDVVRTVFQGTISRMINGYLLRDVLNKVNGIHFTSSEEIHTLAHLYESMLKEMQDAAGDSGEFYTPRPVVLFIVTVINPKQGETILDPAAGTGGFLVESFEYLKKQCKKTEDYSRLQRGTLFGGEAKPLPYLLCQMNLLLHGLESPQVDPGNSLRFPMREIGEKDRVDIVLTNPPFGGSEERGIENNFPNDLRTSETALLFLQLIVRKLRNGSGRCGMVVHDGFLANVGVASRVKKYLLDECDLHTIVRLPFGVFEPYTPIKTNLLFFNKGKKTEGVWFFEIPIVDGRKKYTKTRPLRLEEFQECLNWWNKRVEGQNSWYVPIEEISKRDYSLDFRSPSSEEESVPLEPDTIIAKMKEDISTLTTSLEYLYRLISKPQRHA